MGLWDVESGERMRELDGYADGYGAHALEISKDGRLVVRGCQRDDFSVVELSTGRELVSLSSGDSQTGSFAFSPDGRRVLTGMDDGSALIWDISKAHEEFAHPAKGKP
jgi:WD40 repeat protein